MSTIFEFVGRGGETLREIYSDNTFYFEFSKNESISRLNLYALGEKNSDLRNVYLGHTMDEVLASGKDILGEEMIKNGDPVYSEVKKVMPKIDKSAYCFLGSPASWAGMTTTRQRTSRRRRRATAPGS